MTETKHSYLWRRNEWILSFLLLGLVVGTRILGFGLAGRLRWMPQLEDSESFGFQDSTEEGVNRKLGKICQPDIALLCDPEYVRGRPYVGGCQNRYPRPLGAFLEVEGVRITEFVERVRFTPSSTSSRARYKDFEMVNYGRERSPNVKQMNCSLMNQFPGVAPTVEQTFVYVTEMAADKLIWQVSSLNHTTKVQEKALDQLLGLYLRDLSCLPHQRYVHAGDEETFDLALDWSPQETVDLIGEAISNLWDKIDDKFPPGKESAELTKQVYLDALFNLSVHLNKMRIELSSSNFDSWRMYCRDPSLEYKPEYDLFGIDTTYHIKRCIFRHYDTESLVTNACAAAIPAASIRMKELELEEDSHFLLMTHGLMWCINLTSFLMLLRLFSSKQRTEKRMDRGKRRLEQELSDPVLRQALESKAQSLPEEERRILFEGLEKKLKNWDSKGATTRLVQKYVRRFRYMLLFTITTTTVVYVLLHFFHVSSLPKYLEVIAVSLGIFTASYWIPMEQCDVDASITKSLLSDQDHLENHVELTA